MVGQPPDSIQLVDDKVLKAGHVRLLAAYTARFASGVAGSLFTLRCSHLLPPSYRPGRIGRIPRVVQRTSSSFT